MKKANKVLIVAIILILMCSLAACNNEKSGRIFAFGTYSQITVSGKGAAKSIREIDSLFKRLNTLYEVDGSLGLGEINAASANVTVYPDADVLNVLTLAKEIYAKSGGVFNIGLYNLSRLWRFTSDTYTGVWAGGDIPTVDEIGQALLNCNLADLEFTSDGGVKKINGNLRLDFGSIAKGYAGDRARELIDTGARAVLDVGGTVFTVGDDTFGISIKSPRSSSFPYFGYVAVGGNSVVSTSGDYYKFYTVDGIRYHHILGADGYPVNNGIVSVSVISEDSATSGAMCDILSTTVFALGAEAGKAFAKDYGVSLIIIYDNNTYEVVGGVDFTLTDTGYSHV